MHQKNVDICNVIFEKLNIHILNNDIRSPSIANFKGLFHINLKPECKTLTMKLFEIACDLEMDKDILKTMKSQETKGKIHKYHSTSLIVATKKKKQRS